MLLMCPEWRFDHIVKDTVFTDCSAPRNLQPLGHFRKTYPGPKGDNDSDDDENNEIGGEGTSFGATDPYESIPLHESTRIGETDESSMNLHLSDNTPPSSTSVNDSATSSGWKRPTFRHRTPRSKTNSSKESSTNATPSSPAPSSRRPSRSRSNSTRKRQKADNGKDSSNTSKFKNRIK